MIVITIKVGTDRTEKADTEKAPQTVNDGSFFIYMFLYFLHDMTYRSKVSLHIKTILNFVYCNKCFMFNKI